MYKCEHFAIHELVPPTVYEDRGELAWELLDDRLLRTIDRLRDRYGPATINNYQYSGDRQWSGLRTPDSPWFSPYSQHTFGRAADILFRDVTAEEVREDLRTEMDTLDQGAVEEGVSWLHIDVRNCKPIKWFNP